MPNSPENITLDLVVLGFEVNGLENFINKIDTNEIIKENGFTNGEKQMLQSPGMLPFLVGYRNKNENSIAIQYNLLERKLILTQKKYGQETSENDKLLKQLLEFLLTLTPAAVPFRFGINYNSYVENENKLKLFNSNIENKLGNDLWKTNIGFKTEFAFKNEKYTSVYRIYKDEKKSKEKEKRVYSFAVNFDFALKENNKAEEICGIFEENAKYFKAYKETIEHILEL